MMSEQKHGPEQSKHRADDKPKPPFPPQHQERPGLEAEMTPQPDYQGAQYKAAGKLEGKVAIVTGGDSGIGRSVAYLFAREGADIAILCLEEEHPDALAIRNEIRKLGRRVLMIHGDVSDPEVCARAVRQTVETFGRLNILVNNAAYQQRKKTLDRKSTRLNS